MEVVTLLEKDKSKSNQKKIMSHLKKVNKRNLEVKYGHAQLLSWACYHGNFEAAKYLLKKGSNVNQLSYKNFTPFKWACDSGSIELSTYILRKFTPDLLLENDFKENDFFHICDNFLGPELLEKAITTIGSREFKKIINNVSTKGHTLLSSCLQCLRNTDVGTVEAEREIMSKLDILLSLGANPLVVSDIEGNNMNLMDFVNNNKMIKNYPDLCEKLITLFLELGVRGEVEGINSTLLYQYAYSGNYSVVKSLIDVGYDINKLFKNTSPLMVALKYENFEIARLLMSVPNIDLNIVDENGLDAEFYLIRTDFNELIFEFLEKNGLDKTYKKELINHDFTIPENYNILHLACYRVNIPLILYLLENGLKLDEKGRCSIAPMEILAVMDPDNKLLKFMNQSPTKFEKYAKNKKAGKVFEERECPICLEELDEDITSLKCGHVFHTACILNVLTRQDKCPVCRKPISINFKVNKLLDRSVLKNLSRTKKRAPSRVKSLSLRRRRSVPLKSNNSSIQSPSRVSLSRRSKKIRSV